MNGEVISNEPVRIQGEVVNEAVPIVCIGYSAGGVEPLRTILSNIHSHSGIAWVVVPHLSRTHPTALPELVSTWSKLPATLASTGLQLAPNHVYIVPPNRHLELADGRFVVSPRPAAPGLPTVITEFLESMTRCRKPPGIAVILSGMDADGAAALRDFKAQGGIVLAQDFESAEHADMPRAAYRTGCVDYVLPPLEIAQKLSELGREAAHMADAGGGGRRLKGQFPPRG